MRKTSKLTAMLLLLVSVFFLLTVESCKKPEEPDDPVFMVYGFTGKVQKGPFVTGTEINLYELNDNLVQTGKSFTTTISADDGSFSLEQMKLSSQYALLNADGFFFSEVFDKLSNSKMTLQAIVDISDKDQVNINALTHITSSRIIKLVKEGKGFAEAKQQAEKEFLAFMGADNVADQDFDAMDITSGEDVNGVLLAFSIILHRYINDMIQQQQFTAEMTQLLANLSADFAPDGVIDNRQLIDTLLWNAARVNKTKVRDCLEKRYEQLGVPIQIPAFEKYIASFQEKYDENFITDFYYPNVASPEPENNPQTQLPNVLQKDVLHFEPGSYVAAAAVPVGKKLKIRIIPNQPDAVGPSTPNYGWEITYDGTISGIRELNSLLENEVMACVFYIDPIGSGTGGSAIIEYYEDSETPTFTKEITW